MAQNIIQKQRKTVGDFKQNPQIQLILQQIE